MKKYLLIAKNTWDEVLTYRLNFVMWRVRAVFQLLTVYFLWLAILPEGASIGDYSHSLILTYIFGTSLISAIVFATRTVDVGEQINEGNLSNFLLRPVNFFKYFLARDVGDKAMNISFSVCELIILFFLLRPPLFIQENLLFILLFFASLILAIFMHFYVSILLGFIGFWSPEVWGPRFIFFIVLNFFAGGLFPLDILPEAIFKMFSLLPFTYFLFFPLKIYLGQLSMMQILSGFLIAFIWIIALYKIAQLVWAKGLRSYTAVGR